MMRKKICLIRWNLFVPLTVGHTLPLVLSDYTWWVPWYPMMVCNSGMKWLLLCCAFMKKLATPNTGLVARVWAWTRDNEAERIGKDAWVVWYLVHTESKFFNKIIFIWGQVSLCTILLQQCLCYCWAFAFLYGFQN